MNTLIISNENNIIHIFKDGNIYDYTIYNSKGHNMDGGQLDLETDKSFEEALKEIIEIIKERFLFNLPYTYLYGEKANNLLELIEMEDYKNLQEQINNKQTLDKQDSENEKNIIEKEI